MKKFKVAILGVGAIGEFHAREFHNLGHDVVAILTSPNENPKKITKELAKKYGIKAKPFNDFEKLLKEDLEIISICTPSRFHSQYVKKCLKKGLHVFCEKPFIFDSLYSNYKTAKKLIKLSKKKKKCLSVNTQLVSFLEYLPKKLYSRKIKSFYMYMEPKIEGPINLMAETIPHMNSLLIKSLGKRKIKKLKFNVLGKNKIEIFFNYGKCKVKYCFGFSKSRPRKLKFSIDKKLFERKISGNYNQQLISKDQKINIKDPLKTSIQRFINACNKQGRPLVESSEILYNVKLQDQIIKKYLKRKKY